MPGMEFGHIRRVSFIIIKFFNPLHMILLANTLMNIGKQLSKVKAELDPQNVFSNPLRHFLSNWKAIEI